MFIYSKSLMLIKHFQLNFIQRGWACMLVEPIKVWIKGNNLRCGSCCGSVGRVVDSNSRCPRFKSSHRQKFILNIYCQLYWKDKNKEKRGRSWPIKNNLRWFHHIMCQPVAVHQSTFVEKLRYLAAGSSFFSCPSRIILPKLGSITAVKGSYPNHNSTTK